MEQVRGWALLSQWNMVCHSAPVPCWDVHGLDEPHVSDPVQVRPSILFAGSSLATPPAHPSILGAVRSRFGQALQALQVMRIGYYSSPKIT